MDTWIKGEQKKQVARAGMSFMPGPTKTPLIDELSTTKLHGPKHPMDLFTILQNENPWVDLAVRTIATSCASTMPLFRIEGNKKDKAKIEKYTAKLLQPNQQDVGYGLFWQTYQDLSLYGNSYWQIVKTKGGELHSIYRIPAPYMRVNPVFKDGNLYILYIQERPEKRVYDETEIIHFKMPGADSFIYGKPLFYSNLTNIAIDENISEWVNAFFEKSFSGGFIFKMEADETVAERNRQWLKEEYTKPENAGKPLLLEGELDLVSEGNKLSNLDYKQLKNQSKEEILEHAGVPLSIAGIRSNAGQANIEVIQAEQDAFIRNTVNLYHNVVFQTIKHRLFQTVFNDGSLNIKPGLNRLFSNSNAAKLSEAGSKIALTVNEHREMLQLQPIPEEYGGNMYVVATNNGIVDAKVIYGIDFNTGEKSETLLDIQMEQQKAAIAQAKVAPKTVKKQPGSTNTASNTTSPTGGQGKVKKLKT